ncbi:uncharacterized protein LOC123294037 [Chrysoperla carnea]|uniref:uncharacterized protein LOC123294037 n=1 Tax=Chrysoperla carnea TaxID=189513 RepID=UPI001D0853F2|nr:uncharacterized protein LOC123294037 [Chrysoperla carnea]
MANANLPLQIFKKKWEQNTIFFCYSSVCFICKIYDTKKLKRCSGCKLIAYCSIEHQKMNWSKHKSFCPECEKLESEFYCENKISVHFYSMFYHEFLNIPNVKVPNLNIAFNCGFHENELEKNSCTWRLSLPFMIDVPLAFTSYTHEEALEDMRMVQNYAKNIQYDVVLKCSKNLYSGLKPIRDWEQLQDCFYTNNYISIIKPKLL